MKTKVQWVDTVAGLSADAEALWMSLLSTRDGALDVASELEDGATIVSIRELLKAGLVECVNENDEDCDPTKPSATLVVSQAYHLDVGL